MFENFKKKYNTDAIKSAALGTAIGAATLAGIPGRVMAVDDAADRTLAKINAEEGKNIHIPSRMEHAKALKDNIVKGGKRAAESIGGFVFTPSEKSSQKEFCGGSLRTVRFSGSEDNAGLFDKVKNGLIKIKDGVLDSKVGKAVKDKVSKASGAVMNSKIGKFMPNTLKGITAGVIAPAPSVISVPIGAAVGIKKDFIDPNKEEIKDALSDAFAGARMVGASPVVPQKKKSKKKDKSNQKEFSVGDKILDAYGNVLGKVAGADLGDTWNGAVAKVTKAWTGGKHPTDPAPYAITDLGMKLGGLAAGAYGLAKRRKRGYETCQAHKAQKSNQKEFSVGEQKECSATSNEASFKFYC